MIVLNVFLTIDPSKKTQFVDSLTENINHSKQEAGNDYMDYFSRDNQYVIIEYWKDQAALDLHNQSEHLNKFISQVTGLLQAPVQIEKYTTH